jgi:hypothetical protein
MAYYLYKITQVGQLKQLDKLAEFETFKPASTEAKRLRIEGDLPANVVVKVIFADNELQAEDMLQQVREPEPLVGDDY